MKLLFLTTHNLATNPRLYKELRLAVDNGYDVSLICFEFENWSRSLNEKLKENLPGVNMVFIPAGRSPFLPWFLSTATETVWRLVGRLVPLRLSFLAQAVSRRNSLLIKALDKMTAPDMVVGHNPGALYATFLAGKKFGCKTGFDVEDYHPGEGSDAYLQNLSRKLMKAVLPAINYVSFASPLIQQQVEEDTGSLRGDCFTMMNYFPAAEFPEPKNVPDGPVRFVWFSQNIDYERGLELLVPFFQKQKVNIELHLIGNMNPTFYRNELESAANIIVHSPMPQNELHRSLAGFDIGLALEPAKDRNNELAVSNKLLAYLQSGLYVMATNTPAQVTLLNSFPSHGDCFDFRANDCEATIKKIVANISSIRRERQWRHKNFRQHNWEEASQQLLTVWNRNHLQRCR